TTMARTEDLIAATALDPVCGMRVVPSRAAGSHEHQGTTYYFCSKSCLAKFAADPERWLTPPRGGHEPMGAHGPEGEKVELTCPMHPQIIRDRPGSCPICGMALEPRTISLTVEKNPELIDMERRFR